VVLPGGVNWGKGLPRDFLLFLKRQLFYTHPSPVFVTIIGVYSGLSDLNGAPEQAGRPSRPVNGNEWQSDERRRNSHNRFQMTGDGELEVGLGAIGSMVTTNF
jgi:hypothetical protein